MRVEFTENDLKSGTLVEPAWYVVQIDDVEDRVSSKGDSTNSWFSGHIIKNADSGDEKFKDIPTPYFWMFNSKGAFAMVPLLAALKIEIKVGMAIDTSALKGQIIEMYIGNDMHENKLVNKVMGQYRAYRGA